MKKLMLALAVAVMAAGAQAASVSWSSGVFQGPGGASSKTGTAYSDVYSAIVYFYSDSAGNNLITSATTDDVTKKGLMKGTVDLAEPASGVTQTYYTKMVITEKATGNTLDSGMGSFTWTGGALAAPALEYFGEGAGGFATGGMPANSAGGAANWGGGGGTGGVPEPTSGMLMLVGLGALALRRRRA